MPRPTQRRLPRTPPPHRWRALLRAWALVLFLLAGAGGLGYSASVTWPRTKQKFGGDSVSRFDARKLALVGINGLRPAEDVHDAPGELYTFRGKTRITFGHAGSVTVNIACDGVLEPTRAHPSWLDFGWIVTVSEESRPTEPSGRLDSMHRVRIPIEHSRWRIDAEHVRELWPALNDHLHGPNEYDPRGRLPINRSHAHRADVPYEELDAAVRAALAKGPGRHTAYLPSERRAAWLAAACAIAAPFAGLTGARNTARLLIAWRSNRRVRRDMCPRCKYPLDPEAGIATCPECGTQRPPDAD